MRDASELLAALERGEDGSTEELLPLVYDELRRLAAGRLRHERPGHTMQPTDLVHEAWLRVGGPDQAVRWDGRGHFFAAAAEAMRRILVESARRKKRIKHGGKMTRVNVDSVELPLPMPAEELLALDEALGKLAELDGRAAEVVKLCFFVGLTQEQAAHQLGVSRATAERLWAFARAWLYREMGAHSTREASFQLHTSKAPNKGIPTEKVRGDR